MPKNQNNGNIFLETLSWLCDKLEVLNIPYMVTGGSAVGFWGHIRTTMDIDILVQMPMAKSDTFFKNIKEEAYVDLDEAKRAISQHEMFNIILNKNCFKVDIIPLNEKNDYEVVKFKRRVKIKFEGKEIFVISPEDLIISKLMWGKSAGTSERQLRDCASIWKLNQDKLDRVYIKKWTKQIKIEDEFAKLEVEK